MAQTLESYVAQATNAYKPSATAIQSQIDSLEGKLNATNESINRDYAQQQANLNMASNQAAEAASMQAAGSGGSFGGAANLANRKYYEQSFVPAVTQLQTNRANDLAAARQASDDTRLALNQQLANLQSQAANQGMQQYYASTEAEKGRTFQAEQAQLDRNFSEAQAQLSREWQDYLNDKQYKNEAVEAEKVRQFQAAQAELERQYNAEQARLNREFQAAQNAASRYLQQQQIDSQNAYNQYVMDSAKNAQNQKTYNLAGVKNLDGGYDWTDNNGNLVRVSEVASNAGGDFNNNLYKALGLASNQGDYYSQVVAQQMDKGARFEPNKTGASTGNDMYDVLGIVRIK